MELSMAIKEKVLDKTRLLPLLLSLFILTLDQITKALVVHFIPYNTIGKAFFGDFLWIVHVKNMGVMFSMGVDVSPLYRLIVFCILPAVAILLLIFYYFYTDNFSTLQRFAVAAVIGGGIGNIADRFLRSDGVVDFISVKFYGLFGLKRWPTFNIADASLVVALILIIFTLPSYNMRCAAAYNKKHSKEKKG